MNDLHDLLVMPNDSLTSLFSRLTLALMILGAYSGAAYPPAESPATLESVPATADERSHGRRATSVYGAVQSVLGAHPRLDGEVMTSFAALMRGSEPTAAGKEPQERAEVETVLMGVRLAATIATSSTQAGLTTPDLGSMTQLRSESIKSVEQVPDPKRLVRCVCERFLLGRFEAAATAFGEALQIGINDEDERLSAFCWWNTISPAAGDRNTAEVMHGEAVALVWERLDARQSENEQARTRQAVADQQLALDHWRNRERIRRFSVVETSTDQGLSLGAWKRESGILRIRMGRHRGGDQPRSRVRTVPRGRTTMANSSGTRSLAELLISDLEAST